jgi:uncharacterized protein (DUF58 family)
MIWIVGALIVLLIAYVFDMSLLVYAAYTVLGVLFVTRWLTSRWIENAKATRHCPNVEVEIGATIEVKVEVKNDSQLPISWMLLEDQFPRGGVDSSAPNLVVDGQRVAVIRLGANETQELSYTINCKRRGYYQIGPLVMETGDWFGFHRRYKVLSEPSFILVYPKTVQVAGYNIASRRPIGEVVLTHRFFEDPTRIAGVRQYQLGDPLNRVNWRATARTGVLQSKQYESSTLAGATLLVDFHVDSFDRLHEPYRSELAITAAASLANTLHQMGEQFGLVSNGRDAVDRIRTEGWIGDWRTREQAQKSAAMNAKSDRLRPVVVKTQKSPDQLQKVLLSLARLEKTDGLRLPQLVLEAADQMPRDATVIVLVSQITIETAIALGSLKKQGYAVTAIVNSHNHEAYAHVSSLLLAEGIETRHLSDEASIQTICQKQAYRV